MRGLGCLEDPDGALGNWPTEERLGASGFIPERVDWTPHLDWVRDQGGSQACLGFAFARAIQISRRVQDSPNFEHPSALHIYDIARGFDGRPWIDKSQREQLDAGASPYAGACALQLSGFCSESAVPWDESRVRTPLMVGEYLSAIDQRRVITHRIDEGGPSRVCAIQSAMAAGRGGLIGMDVDEAFLEYQSVTPWRGLQGPRLGGHAMAWCGYDPFSLWIVNSWGAEWGDEGIGRIAWSVVASEQTRSIWVVDSVPAYSQR